MALYPALSASIDARQAEAITHRLLSGQNAQWMVTSSVSHHPLWCVRFTLKSRSLGRLLPSSFTVMVDGVSATGHMVADRKLESALTTATETSAPPTAKPHREPVVDADKAERIARSVAEAALRKRAKLGMSFNLTAEETLLVLKPNWVITAASAQARARLLIDGFNGSHYVMSYEQ